MRVLQESTCTVDTCIRERAHASFHIAKVITVLFLSSTVPSTFSSPQASKQRVLLGFGPEIVLDVFELLRELAGQRDEDACGQQKVHADAIPGRLVRRKDRHLSQHSASLRVLMF